MVQVNPSRATPALQLVQQLAAEGLRIFSTEDARKIAPEVGLSKGYVLQALHHLARTGWLVRLRKGLYVLSSTIPGVSPVHEFEVGMALVDPAAISHFSAMHHYELTDQIPHHVFVTTTSGQWIPRGGKDRGGETGYRAPAIEVSALEPVIYGWLFLLRRILRFRLRLAWGLSGRNQHQCRVAIR